MGKINPDVLYSCLVHDLSQESDSWGPWSSYRDIASCQLRASLLKKFTGAVSPDADDAAFQKFSQINASCATWEPRWESYEDELVGELKRSIYEFWNPNGMPLVSSFEEILSLSRTGPGAAIGARGGDFYTKMFSSPLTTTRSALYDVYRDYIRRFPDWDVAEVLRTEHYGKVDIVTGSRLHFVPKSADISRLICIEPSLNMFFQLGFGARLEARLGKSFGIYLDKQPEVSRELARVGSLDDGPNSPVTIDLTSASDSMSLRMLKEFLPRDFYSWLVLLRSPVTHLGGVPVDLNMVSTMGNGFTFPLQTMLFSCIVSAAARYRGVQLVRTRGTSTGNFSVFGDDIVCPKTISSDVLRLLRICGFQVNEQKTFVEGPFRESCGRDFFRGRDVRGVYIKRLHTQQDRYAAINALNQWSAKTGVYLSTTVQYLRSFVRYQPVPFIENDDAGVKVPASLLDIKRHCRHTKSVLYRRSVFDSAKLRVSDGVILTPRNCKKRIYNPSGLFISLLQGSVVSSSISIRHDSGRYRAKWGVVPYWDYYPAEHPLRGVISWQRWESAVYFNLYG